MNQIKTALIDPFREENDKHYQLDPDLLRERLYKLSSNESSHRGSISEENTNSDEPLEYYEYFMNMAKMIANKKNKKKREGAVIVNTKNKIIGIGHYNQLKATKTELFSWFTKERNSKEENYCKLKFYYFFVYILYDRV